ncbi:MAG: hypothetical protein KDI79_17325 [Anaerolineae bacterium]|nr:hypothetical protein [Anaerolineae bacterium]
MVSATSPIVVQVQLVGNVLSLILNHQRLIQLSQQLRQRLPAKQTAGGQQAAFVVKGTPETRFFG